MALLGVQLVITIIMVSIVHKLGGRYSLARWLLCSTGLFHYLHPENNHLKTLAGVPKNKSKSKGKAEQNGKVETFHVPRSLELELETAPVTEIEVVHLRFYDEFQWLVDFCLYAFIVYLMSEVYHGVFPLKDEVNLSMVWCFVAVLFTSKILLVLTWQYFTGDESIGERSTCIVAGCAFLLIAMVVLIIDERTLETGVDSAYNCFRDNAEKFLAVQGLSSVGPASKLILKLCLAVWAAIVGAVMTFPGMRMARMHWDSMRYCKDNRLKSYLLNINFALPFLLVLLWIRPLSRDYLTERVFSGMDKPIMSEAAFSSLRVWLLVGAVLLRLSLLPVYLQAYLNMAHHRLELLKKEAGRITNVELQKMIASVFYYMCVVALQYVCPLLLCLYLSLMYKTMGDYSWSELFYESPEMCGASATRQVATTQVGDLETSLRDSVEHFHLALDHFKMMFSATVYRGLFGFATWWSCFTWFTTSALGTLYHNYFREA